MTMLKAAAALGVLAIPAMALAHTPINVPYNTRGECEAQQAKDNSFHSFDKVRGVDKQYETIGKAMTDMHDHFWCERDPDDGYWYMLRLPF